MTAERVIENASPYVDRYRITAHIGAGTHGTVFRARDLENPNGEEVVLKRQRTSCDNEGVGVCLLRECVLLNQLEHPNIVRLHKILPQPPYTYLVLENMDMDLRLCLDRYGRHGLTAATAQSIMRQLLRALAFIHARGVIHRDVKPQNVLVDAKGTVKVTDFGLARQTRAAGVASTPEVVTLWYRAPELLLGEHVYADLLDVWSAGCIFAELLTGQPLYPGDSQVDMLRRIFQQLGTPTEASCPGVHGLPDFRHDFPKWKPPVAPFAGWAEQGVPSLQALALRSVRGHAGTAVPHAISRSVLAHGPQRTPLEVELLSRLVVYKHARLTARQALEHAWLAGDGEGEEGPPGAWAEMVGS